MEAQPPTWSSGGAMGVCSHCLLWPSYAIMDNVRANSGVEAKGSVGACRIGLNSSKTQLTLAAWVSFLCGHRKGLVGWRFRKVGRHLVHEHRHPMRDAELAVFTGLYMYICILYYYQYYYAFLWCKIQKQNTVVNCLDTYMYHRNSVDNYCSFRLFFLIVALDTCSSKTSKTATSTEV
jgi:hypothetical protein